MIETFGPFSPQVDPSAFVHASALLIGEVTLGPDASVWPQAVMRGDVGALILGAASNLQDGSVVHCTEGLSTTRIGARVTVGHNVIVHGAHIDDDCLIGMGAIILDNAHIGRHCIIGAGTLITQNKVIPPGSMVMGSPGRVVRALRDDEVAWIEKSWQHYVERSRRYLAAATPR